MRNEVKLANPNYDSSKIRLLEQQKQYRNRIYKCRQYFRHRIEPVLPSVKK